MLDPNKKYRAVARIGGRSNNLEGPNISSWFVVGPVSVKADGKVGVRILGLPLPTADWDGWIYIRETGQETGIIPSRDTDYYANQPKKEKARKRTEVKPAIPDYDDDIPF